MENEYNEKIRLERLPYTRLRWIMGQARPSTSAPEMLADQDRPDVQFKSDWELDYTIQRSEGLELSEKPPV
ncbi:MAG TPA: hypothetical protein DCZ59_05525 [Bacteroidetes bacterium]|nr:hypothetical protein [Bacteroidota bacterium]